MQWELMKPKKFHPNPIYASPSLQCVMTIPVKVHISLINLRVQYFGEKSGISLTPIKLHPAKTSSNCHVKRLFPGSQSSMFASLLCFHHQVALPQPRGTAQHHKRWFIFLYSGKIVSGTASSLGTILPTFC